MDPGFVCLSIIGVISILIWLPIAWLMTGICPKCGRKKRQRQVRTEKLAGDTYLITYRCTACGYEYEEKIEQTPDYPLM